MIIKHQPYIENKSLDGYVKAFYNKLSSKGYAVTAKGYSGENITIADKSDFINAKNYNVLYGSYNYCEFSIEESFRFPVSLEESDNFYLIKKPIFK